MKIEISENWRPTTANINALPAPLRRYIRALETGCDPAGDAQTVANLIGEIVELQKLLAEERRRKDRDRAALSAAGMCQRRFSA
ncbi:MAG TPA: hypothetical protein VFW28_15995 [Micropepsaceae bacterium]|nr:hypothetical protein [Micropepsaceae bacterium]